MGLTLLILCLWSLLVILGHVMKCLWYVKYTLKKKQTYRKGLVLKRCDKRYTVSCFKSTTSDTSFAYANKQEWVLCWRKES